jgi:hypothetical protein
MSSKEHDPLESWLGRHNREMELLRTIFSFLGMLGTFIVILRVFGIL